MRAAHVDLEEKAATPHQAECKVQMKKNDSYKTVKVLFMLGSSTGTWCSFCIGLRPTHDRVSFLQAQSSHVLVALVA